MDVYRCNNTGKNDARSQGVSFLSRDSSNTTSKYNPTIKLIGIIKMHVDRVVASSSKLIITWKTKEGAALPLPNVLLPLTWAGTDFLLSHRRNSTVWYLTCQGSYTFLTLSLHASEISTCQLMDQYRLIWVIS